MKIIEKQYIKIQYMEKVEVYLTPAQHKKWLNKQPFQLSAYQLKASDKAVGKKFHVALELSAAHYKKLLRNVKAGKGYRFTSEAITGGSLLGELWNGAKKVASKVAEYVPADVIRKGVKTGLTAGATALGTMVGNPELGLMAAPLIDKGVDFAEKGYNFIKKKPTRSDIEEQLEHYKPHIQSYVEERVPAARKARKMYEEYAPKARKVYQKARRMYYDEPDDEDDEEDYEPPRRRRASHQRQSAPAPSDYSGYGEGLKGLKKGSPEMKAKMAKLRAMRKGGDIKAESKAAPKPIVLLNNLGQIGGKLVKGSPEMKAKMAKLRAMRGSKAKQPTGMGIKHRKKRGGDLWNPFDADSWKQVGDAITGAANDVGNAIVGVANDAGNAIVNTASDVGNKIASGTTDVVNQIGDSLRGAADNVVSFYQEAASTASPLVNQAIAEVAKNLPSEADAAAFGKQVASALIHQGIPQATAAICGALAEAVFPEGGPVSAQLGSQLGKMLGEKLADKIGEESGYGLRRRRGHLVMVKGGTLLKGVPYPHYTPDTETRIQMRGLAYPHKGKNGLHRGGSFAPLGGGN
jgi:hypothetical protein